MKPLLVSCCLLLGPFTMAVAGPLLMVRGTLAGFDAETIAIKQSNESKIVLPRSSVPSLRGYTAGFAEIVAYVEPADLVRLNPSIGTVKSK